MGSQLKPDGFQRVLFGPFEYEESSGELRKHGVRIRLQGQPLQILSALLKRQGQIVTREEFQQELWQGSTFVGFEHGLNAAMNRLRQALGDSAEQPRYIETLPGKGYRFIAPIQSASPKALSPITPLREASEVHKIRPAKKHRWLPWTAAAALVTALTVGYMAGRRQELTAPAPLRFSVAPPEGFVLEPASSRQSLALSPDGSRLAFTAMDASGLFSVFVRDLRTLEPRLVPNTTGSHSVFWAPDGRSIYFTVRGKLRRADPNGDSYQELSDVPTILSSVVSLPGRLLLVGTSGAFTIPASGGALQPVKDSYRWSQMLPDGKNLLYTVFDPDIGRHRTRAGEFGKPENARDLLETDSRTSYARSVTHPKTGYLMSVRAGNLLAHPFDPHSLTITGQPVPIARGIYSFFSTGAADFSVSGNGVLAYQKYLGRSQLAWVDRKGQVIQTIGPGGVNLKFAGISPDGRKIATAIWDVERGVSDIWIIDAGSGAARRLFAGPLAVNPIWSPDSRRLAYARSTASALNVFIRGIGENDPEQALPPDSFQLPTDWSRDGRFIALMNTGFVQVENEFQGDVQLVDLRRGRRMIPLVNTPFHETSPLFSPDGRWLAFMSNESGRIEIYLQAFTGGDSPKLSGERYLVSRHGAACARWRRDGRELFYVGADGRLYAVPMRLSSKPQIGPPVPLFSISLEARSAIHSLLSFDASADGSRFLIPTVTSSEKSEIVVVQNWEATITR